MHRIPRLTADLSLPLDPRGTQPSAYGVPPASARPYSGEGFVLDVSLGGSCNCEVLQLIPHCQTTHTESVGHLTRERFPLAEVELPFFMPCLLITVQPDGRELRPAHFTSLPEQVEALVVRTLPNDDRKRTRQWENATTPYLTPEAMATLRTRGVKHLLVDLPSVDPLADNGILAAHRVFWDMPPGSTDLPHAAARERTITELIFVKSDIPDGSYRLMIQVPNIISDAVPSRPLLFELEETA